MPNSAINPRGSVGTMSAPMPSNLLLYEKDNNLLLKALRVS